MHCQSQISIIRNNGVERAHKSKNADKTHLDKLYEQGGHKEERKVRALIQMCQPRTPCFSAASVKPSSGSRVQTCSHCPPSPGWFSTAVCLLLSICSLPSTVCSPQIPIIHVPGSVCTPNHTHLRLHASLLQMVPLSSSYFRHFELQGT